MKYTIAAIIVLLGAIVIYSITQPELVFVLEKRISKGATLTGERMTIVLFPSREIKVINIYGIRTIWQMQEEFDRVSEHTIHRLEYPLTWYY